MDKNVRDRNYEIFSVSVACKEFLLTWSLAFFVLLLIITKLSFE